MLLTPSLLSPRTGVSVSVVHNHAPKVKVEMIPHRGEGGFSSVNTRVIVRY